MRGPRLLGVFRLKKACQLVFRIFVRRRGFLPRFELHASNEMPRSRATGDQTSIFLAMDGIYYHSAFGTMLLVDPAGRLHDWAGRFVFGTKQAMGQATDLTSAGEIPVMPGVRIKK